MIIHATINSAVLKELQIMNSNRAMFRGRQIDYTTTFFECLEIRAIREPNGHTISASEIRNWPDYRIAQDEGIMALFASNRKWKKLKFGIDQHDVDLAVVNGVASVQAGNRSTLNSIDPDIMAHLMYATDLMDSGFAYQTQGTFPSHTEISKSQMHMMISTGDYSNLYVKTRVGNLEMWVPLLQAAACVPQRPVQNDHQAYAAAGDVIAKLFTAAVAAWARR